jgi:MFS family permease
MSASDGFPRPIATVEPAPGPAPTPPRVSRGTFAPFRSRNFSLLFSGQFISVIGDQVYGLALPWTVLAATGDPRKMAIVLTAEAVPRALLLLVGGALSDRLSPRVVMLAADLSRMLVVAALGAILFFGLPPLWIVATLAALQGLGSGLFGPGIPAFLPRILPEEQLPAGNGLMQVIQFATLTFGPLLGGIATAGEASIAFLADAASFAVSAATLAGVRLPPRSAPAAKADHARPARRSLTGEIGEGIVYAVRQPLVRATITVTIFANLGLTAVLGVGLIVLSRNLSPNPIRLGEMLSVAGVGGGAGGLVSAVFTRLRRRGLFAMLLFGVSCLLMASIAVISGPAARLPFPVGLTLAPGMRISAVASALGVMGFVLGLANAMFLTVMQQKIAPELLARVFSLQVLAGSVVGPIALVGAGYLTAAAGPGVTFIASGAVTLLGIVIGLFSSELRRM